MKNLIESIIIGVIIIMPFSSCERLVHARNELVVYVENKLDKPFMCNCITNFGEKQIFIDSFEIDSMLFVNEQIIDISFLGKGEYDYEPTEIIPNNIIVRNITDTTNFELLKLNDDEINIFNSHYVSYLDVLYGYNSTIRDTLTIDSTLLPIFKRDYTMLEEFKEYYK